eukprot:6976195-Pyramimonas_sp.AAC.1
MQEANLHAAERHVTTSATGADPGTQDLRLRSSERLLGANAAGYGAAAALSGGGGEEDGRTVRGMGER